MIRPFRSPTILSTVFVRWIERWHFDTDASSQKFVLEDPLVTTSEKNLAGTMRTEVACVFVQSGGSQCVGLLRSGTRDARYHRSPRLKSPISGRRSPPLSANRGPGSRAASRAARSHVMELTHSLTRSWPNPSPQSSEVMVFWPRPTNYLDRFYAASIDRR